ncbi:MAG: hypothetical protein FRX48_07979 [Lasallia pustulata]|uniref:Uncharacterized protein n=1 Tax=Lasallia pustulata TaxID=136370 RepID=A0A5M8PFX2_9LECA|nr:MAG: hypothetical protein FRX48_07979 [Lasallia pustulata]
MGSQGTNGNPRGKRPINGRPPRCCSSGASPTPTRTTHTGNAASSEQRKVEAAGIMGAGAHPDGAIGTTSALARGESCQFIDIKHVIFKDGHLLFYESRRADFCGAAVARQGSKTDWADHEVSNAAQGEACFDRPLWSLPQLSRLLRLTNAPWLNHKVLWDPIAGLHDMGEIR